MIKVNICLPGTVNLNGNLRAQDVLFTLIRLPGVVLENGHCYRIMAVFTGKGTKTGYSEARTRINQVCVATLRFMASTVLLLTTFGAGICQATSITISGHVIDTAGAAIAGAAVAFRSSGTEVLTDTDGSFSLEKSVNAISAPDYHAIMPKDGSIAIQGGKIRVNTTGSASVLSVKAYEINGRLLFQKQHALVSGENTFALPTRGSNLYICQITSGNHRVTVKHIPAVKLTTVLESSSLYHRGQSHSASAIQVSPDIIDAVKEGMLDYHTTVYGCDTSGIIITMLPSAGTVTDADGNIYQSVRIGNQVWTTQNLKTTKYNDGSPIPCITDNIQWAQCTTGAYCSYENSASNATTFGLLYSWYVVATGKLAPEGWRIPSASDFDTLKAAITAQMAGDTVLNSVKIAGRTHWTPSTGVSVPGNITDSTNSTGFSALPGGIRDLDGSFCFLDTKANFWTVTPDTVQHIGAQARRLIYSYNNIWEGVFNKRCGSSVRLIRVEGITDSGKAITDFYLPGFKTRGFINEETKEIYVVLPNKSNVKAIRPIITYTGKSISPDSTGMLDFTNPVKYTITAFDGSQSDYSVIMQKSDLPVLYINTPNSVPINSKEVWIEDASYKLIDESGFILNGHMSIKGRGNTTMGMPKTPFNIKLPKNNDEPFLGMPSHRRWVLLANYSDKSLLRTDVAFKLGETLDNLKWTPRSRHIVLNLNEEYQGVYQLVEQIKIDPNRINIAPTISSTQPDGGYLLEIDTRKGEQFNFTTNLGVVFNLKDPDENMEGVFENVKMNIQAIEDVIYSDSFTDTATGYSKYIDVQTFVDWYLANEITKNNDAIFFSSVYLYYNPADKRIHMGPLWDFDISSGNIDYSICKSPEGFYIKDNTFWISRLFEDPAFVRMVKDRWDEKRTEIFELLSYIKNQAAFLNNAQELNFKKWDILGVYVWPNPVVTGSYDGEIQYLHSWLSSRLNWLDLNINLLD